ncbi:50S ribosomal protein L32, partial [Streptomyces bacillaris]|uniref:50S ribosomal protein L32 n=1 Tax=Streptomyces bacillaris TaxID=68179 RepID=UPI0036468656
MAVPKRKMSRSNTRHRRAQWKATTPQHHGHRLGPGQGPPGRLQRRYRLSPPARQLRP